jgi:hypothetical protein
MSQSRDVAYDVVGPGSNSLVTAAYQSVLKDLKPSTAAIRLPHRLMLLVTDGLPCDPEYESAYAEADVHMALGEARAAGTARLCLCVDSATDIHNLHTMLGTTNCMAVEKPRQIATHSRARCQTALVGVPRRNVNRMRLT